MSRDAMRIPNSAIRAVSSRAHVGSPLAFPWPNTCQKHTEFKYTHTDPANHTMFKEMASTANEKIKSEGCYYIESGRRQ